MKLGDVAYYVTKRVSAEKVTKDTYISTENMRPNKDGFMPSDELPPYPSYISYDEHDILISNIRPYFKKILYAKANGGCSNDVLVLRAKDPDNYSSSFLYYALSQDYFFNFMMAGAKGTKMPRGNKKSILDFELPEYNLAKQKRIVSILSHYDDLIEINKRRIALLEESARELYKEWFVRMRFPNYEKVHFVEGKPEDWDLVNLTDIIEIRYGKDHKALEDGNIPCYGSGGIMRYVESQLYNGECVLIPRKGTLNNIMWVNGPFWTIDTMFYGIPMKEHVAKLVFFYLSSLNMEMFNAGAALPSMTTKILSKLSFPLPPMDIRNAFENKLGDIFSLVKTLTKYNELLSLQRDRLLPRLMSGQLEV